MNTNPSGKTAESHHKLSQKQLKKDKYESQKCSNWECFKKGSVNSPLKNCARCKAAKYCSKECQTAHWKTHKEFCQKNAAHAEALSHPMNPLRYIPLPDGMSLSEMDQRLEKWVKFHNTTLMAATIHALSLPTDITRARTHVLRLHLAPRTDHGGSASKFFRINYCAVISMEEGRKINDLWSESLDDLRKLREDSESVNRGTVAAAAVESLPLGVQIVPFGSLQKEELSSLPFVPNWKEILIQDVEKGKRFGR